MTDRVLGAFPYLTSFSPSHSYMRKESLFSLCRQGHKLRAIRLHISRQIASKWLLNDVFCDGNIKTLLYPPPSKQTRDFSLEILEDQGDYSACVPNLHPHEYGSWNSTNHSRWPMRTILTVVANHSNNWLYVHKLRAQISTLSFPASRMEEPDILRR